MTWRDAGTPARIHAVGCLAAGEDYSFAYLPGAGSAPGFRPFPGLPAGQGPLRSHRLFLFFADRLMDPKRPDFQDYVQSLDLPARPSELDLLARSEGVMKGDRVAVVEEPGVTADRSTDHVFVVRGVRFALQDPSDRESVLARLAPGVPLDVQADLGNPVNEHALGLVDPEGRRVGWVPDALVPYVSSVLRCDGAQLRVQRVNGPAVPPHLRLLARVSGRLPHGVTPLPQVTDEQVAASV